MTLYIITQKEPIKNIRNKKRVQQDCRIHNQYTKIVFLKNGNKCSENKIEKTILFK